MAYYIGIDLGTSSVKLLLLSGDGEIVKTASRDYPLSYPQSGWSEQSPTDWYEQTLDALGELLEDIDRSQLKALSFSGQMHGLVLLDENGEVLRPAILWNDGRTGEQTDWLNNEFGREKLLDLTGNIAFAGFTAPKLLWVRENEPEIFAKTTKILLPKDYLAYRLCGNFCTDVSDASGTLYFDVKNRCWSAEMLELLGIDESKLPAVLESSDKAGTLLPELAKRFSLPEDTSVVIGGGDNAVAAVGTGVMKNGDCNISLGTSGTIFVVSDSYGCDRKNAIHSFCSAGGNYHYMACMLSAAVCRKWFIEDILESDDYSDPKSEPGENSVFWLPYLMGERSPLNDPKARALFFGMSLDTTRDDMDLAIIEGVSFALRQSLDLIRALGVEVSRSRICGGGAKSGLWLKILASVLNTELDIPLIQQGAALGSALLAAKGVLPEADFDALYEKLSAVKETISPDPTLRERYEKKYKAFLRLYPAVMDIYAAAQE